MSQCGTPFQFYPLRADPRRERLPTRQSAPCADSPPAPVNQTGHSKVDGEESNLGPTPLARSESHASARRFTWLSTVGPSRTTCRTSLRRFLIMRSTVAQTPTAGLEPASLPWQGSMLQSALVPAPRKTTTGNVRRVRRVTRFSFPMLFSACSHARQRGTRRRATAV